MPNIIINRNDVDEAVSILTSDDSTQRSVEMAKRNTDKLMAMGVYTADEAQRKMDNKARNAALLAKLMNK